MRNAIDDMKKMEDVIESFRDKILERENVHYSSRKSNKLHDEIHEIFKTLRKNGNLIMLEPLLNDQNISVASYAAQYFLIEDEKKALSALKALGERKGVDPFTINYTIRQWKNGELNFDY